MPSHGILTLNYTASIPASAPLWSERHRLTIHTLCRLTEEADAAAHAVHEKWVQANKDWVANHAGSKRILQTLTARPKFLLYPEGVQKGVDTKKSPRRSPRTGGKGKRKQKSTRAPEPEAAAAPALDAPLEKDSVPILSQTVIPSAKAAAEAVTDAAAPAAEAAAVEAATAIDN